MSLIHVLLDGPKPAATRMTHTGRVSRVPSLLESIKEAARNSESLTLSEGEVRQLVRILEKSYDPFSVGKSVLDAGDLEALEVEASSVGKQYGIPEPKDSPEDDHGGTDPNLSKKQPIFGPESALVAPDCTPGADEDIPASVLSSLDVLAGEEPKELPPEGIQTEPSRSPALPTMPRVRQPETRRTQPEQSESVALAAIRNARSLRENLGPRTSRRTIKKALTPEQLQVISKLSGPAD